MPKFVVCMDSFYVRDCQMFDSEGMSEEQFENIDPHGEEGEKHWHDMEPNPYIDAVTAENEAEACKIAGEEQGYDPRTLFAIQV